MTRHQRERQRGGGRADTQTQKACSQKCCVVDTRAWPEAEALPSAWGGLGHRAPFDTTLSPTPFFWEGSSTQPCLKNGTEDSGTWSNNNTQWGLLSLITQEPLPDKSQSSFWEFPQPQEASSSTSVFEIIESQVAVDGRGSKTGQSGREEHLHSPVQDVLYTGARGGKPESTAFELGSIHWCIQEAMGQTPSATQRQCGGTRL